MRELRSAAGYGLNQFAALLGVTPQSLSDYEIHGRGIGRESLFKAADLLDIDPRILGRPPAPPLLEK